MRIDAVGIASDGAGPATYLDTLEQNLDYLQSVGYDLIEIDSTPFRLIFDGRVREPQLREFVAVLRNFSVRYSLHGLMRLNLAYDSRHDLCRRIMVAQIEICRAIGATRLVYHSGLQALDAARSGIRSRLFSDEELEEGASREVDAFKYLAPIAEDSGVVIGMENGDPHLWEYTVIEGCGESRDHLSKHHARLLVDPILRQLQEINHPNVGMTLDIGHLYIAAHTLDFDYLEAVSCAAPWVKHLHFSDNFGRLDQGFDAEWERWAFGEADIHMPPGWGSIPYRGVLACLPEYHGDIILEIKPFFRDYLGDGLRAIQDILADM